jgi:hypothetical protein
VTLCRGLRVSPCATCRSVQTSIDRTGFINESCLRKPAFVSALSNGAGAPGLD